MPTITQVFGILDDAQKKEARRILRTNDCGEVVGYRPLSTSGPTCAKGCLAPGSSRHSHAITHGWLLIGTKGLIEVDLTFTPLLLASIRTL